MSRQQRRALERQRAKEFARSAGRPNPAPSAKPSTGPRTVEGKAIASQNAFSHGLTSARLVLPWENKAEFEALLEGFIADHQPATTTEAILVREMAEQYWRLQRARNQEFVLLTAHLEPSAEGEKAILLVQRYATRHERAFHKCLSTLRSLQKERHLAEKEALVESPAEATAEAEQFVSQKSESTAIGAVPPADSPDPSYACHAAAAPALFPIIDPACNGAELS